MSSSESQSAISHKFGQQDNEMKIENKNQNKNNNSTPPSTEGGDNNKNTSTNDNFINETDFGEVQSAIGAEERALLKLKLLNNHNTNIPIEGLEKFTKWLALSTEVLKANKNVVKYNLNTMTNNEAKATGVVESLQQGVNQGETVSSHHWNTMFINYDREATLANASVGFPAVHEKIDELLVQRLTESVGKQSPINGKVLDLKSIINANVLPVIKNGNIDYVHRILETTVQMLGILNMTPPNMNIVGVVDHYTVEDLTSASSRERLEMLTNTNNCINDIVLALKSVNSSDMMDELAMCIKGSLQLINPSHVRIRTYGLNDLTASQLYNDDAKYDISPLAARNGYAKTKTVPMAWIGSDPSNVEIWLNDRDDGLFTVATFNSAGDRTAVKNWIDSDPYRAHTLIYGTSVTIGGTTYNYALSAHNGQVLASSVSTNLHRSNYVSFENYADILNAIDLLAHLTCSWNYHNSATTTASSPLTRSTDKKRLITPSSIWARIAMLYGQLKYVNTCERNLGDQTLLSNKIFNYAYYLAGSRGKLIQNSYGSFQTYTTHVPSLIYPSFQNADRVLKFKHDSINHYVPLLNYSSDLAKTNIIVGYLPPTATGYIFAEYFTEPRWWRYDYFGNLKQTAPTQRLSANQTDQEYDESSDVVFCNVGEVSQDQVANIGTATIRFSANGQFTPIVLQSISYCPNTALRLIIPNIFKVKKRTKCMLLHGLDLSYRAAPVWYGYYDYVRTMVDDGSFEEDVLDELF